MAPLLGRKPYALAKPLAESPGLGEEVYIIEHTKEAFRNKEEYEARLQRYNEHIWTCKSTGSNQLTHKEAWEEEQEVTELLQEEYPQWFEKPVLEIVHHNTVSLDKLVEMAWLEILTKYAVDEECDFLVGKDKSLRVKVVKIHPLENPEGEVGEKKLEGACDSPSSDKENATQENQGKELSLQEGDSRRESLSDRARRSPRKLPAAMKEEKKKWVMPKFLPHKYDVKLVNEDKVISDVPAESLFRTERPPTKEITRYFIRHYALRIGMGESAPWVVEDDLVKKFNLPSKFSDFLLDPHKFLAENPSTKRKSLPSPEGKPSKKLKTSDASGEGSGNDNTEKRMVKNKKDSLTMPLCPNIWVHLQKLNGSPFKVKNSGTPKKAEGKSSAPSTPKSGKKSGGKKTAKGNEKKQNGAKASKKDGKLGPKSPKMKQMTLLHLAKSTPSGSPRKRARSVGGTTPKLAKPLPPMALHLLRYYKVNKGKEDKKNALSCLISKAAKALSPDDRSRLPDDELSELVQKRWVLLEQKRRWASMSEEQRQEETKKKREELRERMREKAKERREKEMQVRREMSRRYEDQAIAGGRSLPSFKLVDMPEGLPNTLFGDVAMVVEFLNSYAGLLMPDDQYPVTAAALMEALAGEAAGFHYLNRVLVVLLQTLLQDELAEGYSELDVPLSEIPLTMHSVSELVRLCLRPSDAHAGSNDSRANGLGSDDWPAESGADAAVTAELLERLEMAEVFELTPAEKVGLLVALCNRILMTYSVEEHVDARQQRSAELWKERLAALKEVNDRKREEKKKRKEMEDKGKEEPKADKPDRKKEGGPKVEVKMEAVKEEGDMISSVKSRRLMSIQAKKDKEEQDRQNKERMEKEAEEERVRKQKASAERAFQDGIAKAKLVLRRVPLGTDRNHNRYWLFSDVVPGLYIEKGWVHDCVDYNYSPPPDDKPVEPEEEQEEDDYDAADKDDGSTDGAASEGAPHSVAAADVCIETTIPKQGQNLWFICDSTADLDALLESLHSQGARESELKLRVENRYQDIVHSINLSRKGRTGLRICDGHKELLKYLRTDIQEVASRLHKGGLGYLDDDNDLEEQVQHMESLKDFGECVITLQACVIKKFLQGFMAPKQKSRRKQAGEESTKAEEVDEEKKLAQEARVATAVEKWKSAIQEAQTFSRMHVLLGMLDACIKWDMSAENARCKVCRRKGDDEKLILCDGCNKAFHLFCLRPALYRIPDGEWLCPACQPTQARRFSRSRNYNEDTEDEEDESEEEDDDESKESDVELNDYTAMGHSLRPRKKNKQSSSRPKCSKSSKAKKQSPSSGRSSKQRTAPSSPADIDELVRQSSKTGMKKQTELERCEEILQKLIKFRYSWPFREPVSTEEAEDYLDVISTPMDFQSMQAKLAGGSYRHAQDFLEDVKLVFSNAVEYNREGSPVLACLAKTEHSFTELLHKLLPGLTYVRRRCFKRTSRPPAAASSSEEEEEEEHKAKKLHNGKPSRLRREATSRGSKVRAQGGKEEESEEEEQGKSRGTTSRRSQRASATKQDYRERGSDSDHDTRDRTRRRHQQEEEEAGGGSSDEAQHRRQRHSKRQKR